MSVITLLFFIIAALLGVFLIYYILTGKNTPKGLAIIHGLTAALGIVSLVIVLIITHVNAYISLVLFILAALGGFLMMYRDITGKSLPKWLALGHGLIALSAFILLLLALYWSKA